MAASISHQMGRVVAHRPGISRRDPTTGHGPSTGRPGFRRDGRPGARKIGFGCDAAALGGARGAGRIHLGIAAVCSAVRGRGRRWRVVGPNSRISRKIHFHCVNSTLASGPAAGDSGALVAILRALPYPRLASDAAPAPTTRFISQKRQSLMIKTLVILLSCTATTRACESPTRQGPRSTRRRPLSEESPGPRSCRRSSGHRPDARRARGRWLVRGEPRRRRRGGLLDGVLAVDGHVREPRQEPHGRDATAATGAGAAGHVRRPRSTSAPDAEDRRARRSPAPGPPRKPTP